VNRLTFTTLDQPLQILEKTSMVLAIFSSSSYFSLRSLYTENNHLKDQPKLNDDPGLPNDDIFCRGELTSGAVKGFLPPKKKELFIVAPSTVSDQKVA